MVGRRGIEQLFQLYPDLKKAWLLKESLRAWYRQADRKQAEASLKSLEAKMEQANVPEFRDLRYILSAWRERSYSITLIILSLMD